MIYSYYLPFKPAAAINYAYLLKLHRIAQYSKETKLYNTIHYSSLSELAKRLDISSKTLQRMLQNTAYSDFFTIDKSNKKITLLNDYRSGSSSKRAEPFIRINAAAIDKLLEEYEKLGEPNTDLFIRYYLYIVYYCRKDGSSDFTGEQFLVAAGYSTTTGTRQKLCTYNKIYKQQLNISIVSFYDGAGHKRNRYSLL